uniref:Uncharacterized protein n=1 Tax=Kalanchoe fedtschenkoi TaxID=63787 RepID=A0A7N0T8Z1_KALFE
MASRVFFLRQSTAAPNASSSSSSILLQRRRHSAKAGSTEPSQDPPSAPAKPDQLSPVLTVFEDLIHGMIVRRCQPAWLPFVPGSSFWVPPRPQSGTFAKAIEKLSQVTHSLSDDETMALTTMRGWPSSAFFLQGKETDLEKVGTIEMADKDSCLTDAFASEDMHN